MQADTPNEPDHSLQHTTPNQPDRSLKNTTTTSHYAKSRNRAMVIDLTLDDEDDEPTIKTEQGNTLQTDTDTSMPSSQQPENHPPQLDSAPQVDLMKEFAGMMAGMVSNFGIEALGHPEARRLRMGMGQAAKSGDKALLCQLFGALDAVLQASQ